MKFIGLLKSVGAGFNCTLFCLSLSLSITPSVFPSLSLSSSSSSSLDLVSVVGRIPLEAGPLKRGSTVDVLSFAFLYSCCDLLVYAVDGQRRRGRFI